MKRSNPRPKRGRAAWLLTVVPFALLCFAASGSAAPTAGSADLQVGQVAGASSVPAGSNLGYTITVVNLGPETATGVTVEDPLPSNVRYVSASSTIGTCGLQGQRVVCSVGTLEAGSAATVSSATISLDVIPRKAGSITNVVSVHGDQADPDSSNNETSVTTSVTEGPPKYKPTPKPPSHGRHAAYCRGVRATMVGTRGHDTLIGTRGRDVIVAFGGADRIITRGGRDLICAGRGRDYVNSGRGADRVFGGAGGDRLLGRGGPDLLKGQTGDDVLKGGTGADRIRGGRGLDRCRGGAGRDSIRRCER